jgi:hypothetical protein
MVITILAEPRSGSTNLANWFSRKNNFTILYEPITSPNLRSFQNGIHPSLWKHTTEYLLVKEIYRPNVDFSELIGISDKVIILYRENITEQTESWLNANKTNNWDKAWVYKENLIKNENSSYFNEIKKGIKENYLNNDYFNISYEELYYNNGFQKVLNYLNINNLENKDFPYGSKYRVERNMKSLI